MRDSKMNLKEMILDQVYYADRIYKVEDFNEVYENEFGKWIGFMKVITIDDFCDRIKYENERWYKHEKYNVLLTKYDSFCF